MADSVREEETFAALGEQRKELYALIGHCITEYQSVEDYLPTLFVAALGGEPNRAEAIFKVVVVRGLKAKIDIISAALITAEKRHQKRWATLCQSVELAAAARNEIAHSSPVHHNGEFTIVPGEDGGPST